MGQDFGQVEVDLLVDLEVDLADTGRVGVVDMRADAAGSRGGAQAGAVEVAVWAWDSNYSAVQEEVRGGFAAEAVEVVALWVPCRVVGGNHRVAGDAFVEA